MSKTIWVVESANEADEEIFEDWVPADSAEQARAEVEKLRDYATVCEVHPLENDIEFLTNKLRSMREVVDNPSLQQRQWDEFVREAGERLDTEFARLPDGRLVEMGQETERCEACGKVFERSGDSWADLDPECADRVSEYMDAHGVRRDRAIKALRKELAKEK